MDQLSKLVSRLETVTAKLENLGQAKPQLAPKPPHLGGGGNAVVALPEIANIQDLVKMEALLLNAKRTGGSGFYHD
ncbi:hypothetical protein TELCIR_05977 [Teladorsagia circumcincta]|uniref:Uncharacterized protein n=1 Tax=Teladorsagia circumcincta TaxID=45464 RepID=A0A2G9UPB7_TELCI|nr:hypothetical protein TELCIR_05977 [Teladorsagia circumcincta]